MKFKEIVSLNQVELQKRLNQAKKELFDSRIKLYTKKLANPLSIRFLRRDIARLKTALGKQSDTKKVTAMTTRKQNETDRVTQ